MIEAPGAVDAALTSFGLADWEGPSQLDRATVEQLLARPPHDGLVPLLNAALDAGAVAIPDDLVPLVRSRWQDEMVAVVALDIVLGEVTTHLHRAGIPTRVLKGVAVAALDEVSPTWRRYGDVDVLVPADRLLEAADAVAEIGFRPGVEPVRKQWAARYAKTITMVGADGTELDLHRQIAAGPFGSRIRGACLFEQGRPFAVGGRPLVALSDVHRFAHACYHAALGGVTGHRHHRDIALTARRVSPETLLGQCSDGWSPTIIASAVRSASAHGAVCPHEWETWAQAWVDHPADVRLRRAYDGSFGDLARAEFAELPGPWAKARYATGLLLPSREHLETRAEGRWQRWRRMAANARRS